jgi:hypothetical protein
MKSLYRPINQYSYRDLEKEVYTAKSVRRALTDEITHQFFLLSIRAVLIEQLTHTRNVESLTKNELIKSFDIYASEVDDGFDVNRAKGMAPDTFDDEYLHEIEVHAGTVVLSALTDVVEKSAPVKPFKNPGKPTRRELERHVNRERAIINELVDTLSHLVSQKRLHIEILESIVEQLKSGEITFGEFKQWSFKWNIANHKYEGRFESPEQMREYLGLTEIDSFKRRIDDDIYKHLKGFVHACYYAQAA